MLALSRISPRIRVRVSVCMVLGLATGAISGYGQNAIILYSVEIQMKGYCVNLPVFICVNLLSWHADSRQLHAQQNLAAPF